MAGEAKTSQFLLADATVMIGPLADLLNLNPDEHSIGLVKNFAITGEPAYTDLMQGVKNDLVYSVMTDNTVTATMEVYEYTSKNLAYGLGLDGADYSLAEAAAFTLNADAVVDDEVVGIDSATDIASKFPAGCWIGIQPADPEKADAVHIAQVKTSSYAAEELTLDIEGFGLPLAYKTGDKIFRVADIPVGSKDEQPFLSAKIVGILPEGKTPLTILIPKLRITKGFNVAFQNDGFGNLPYEFRPYNQVASDPMFAKFGRAKARIFRT